MNPLIRTAFFFASAVLSAQVCAADFQLKGRTLGMDEKSACGEAAVTSRQISLDAAGVKGIDFPATSCELFVETVAGLKPSGPMLLLFWKGRLIRLIVNFGIVDLSEAAALRTTFINSFGKPSTKRSDPFRTDYWFSGKQSLESEWVGRIPADVSAYLTDSVGWADYQNVQSRAVIAIKSLETKQRANDLRN